VFDSMIQIIVLHQKPTKPNSWVNSIILVQKVCKQPVLLSVMIHGTSVVVLQIVLLILVSLMMIVTKNSVINVQITLTGFSNFLDNVILLLKNVLHL
jgi:hypothetical protein